jgi:tRNA U38,U39,U40 pseudouridine synthase TruA
MKTLPTLQNLRFASCARDATMLKDFVEIAGDNFVSALIRKMNLTRGEIFRGKISRRQNQLNKTDLEERTPLAPNK